MIIRENLARDALRLFIWFPFRWICRIAPIGFNYRMFELMGRIHYRMARARRATLGIVFYQSFPEESEDPKVNGWVLDYFINHYIDRMSIFHYDRLHESNLAKAIELKGLDLLDETLSRGKGCLLIHGHIGPSQLPLVALGRLGYAMTQIGFRSDDGLSFIGKHVQLRHRMTIEERFPAEMLYADKFQRQVFKSLASGRVVMIAGDGTGNERRFGRQRLLPFLGRQMDFPLGPFRLATKARTPVLFLSVIRGDGRARYRAEIQRPVLPIAGDGDAAEEVLQDAFVGYLERWVASDPGLWQFWDQFLE